MNKNKITGEVVETSKADVTANLSDENKLCRVVGKMMSYKPDYIDDWTWTWLTDYFEREMKRDENKLLKVLKKRTFYLEKSKSISKLTNEQIKETVNAVIKQSKVEKTVSEEFDQNERNCGFGMCHMLYLPYYSTEDLEKECRRIEHLWKTGVCIKNENFWNAFCSYGYGYFEASERTTEEKYLKSVKYHVWFGDLKKYRPIDYLSHEDVTLLWRYFWFKHTIDERGEEQDDIY